MENFILHPILSLFYQPSLLSLGVCISPTWIVFTFSVLVTIGLMSTMKYSSVIWTSARAMGILYMTTISIHYHCHDILINAHQPYSRIDFLFFYFPPSFLTAHIWACPPSEGDDYIFHCHPLEQKVPKPKRLVDWYKKMLDKGKSDSVVYDYRVSLLFFINMHVYIIQSFSYSKFCCKPIFVANLMKV